MSDQVETTGGEFWEDADDAQALQRYRTLVNAVDDGIYQLDADGRFVAVNDVILEMSGYSREELLGAPVSLVLSDDDVARIERELRELLEAGGRQSETFEFSVRTSSGDTLPCEVQLSLLVEEGTFRGTVGIVRDVADRKQLEQELRKRERQLQRRTEELSAELGEIYGRITDGVLALNEAWEFTHVNERAEEILGLDKDELLGENIWETFPEMVGSEFEERYRAAMESQEPASFEAYYPPFDAWFEEHVYPSETGLSIYFRNVTRRKEREEKIRERERQFQTLAENLDQVVWMTTADPTDLVYVNPVYEDVWEQDRETLYEDIHVFTEAIHPEDRERVREAYAALPEGDYNEEFRVVQSDGTVRWLHARAVPVRDDAGEVRYIVGIADDITEQREREQYLREAKAQLEAATEAGAVGTWEWHIPEDRMVTGASFARTFGVDPDAAREGVSLDRFLSAIHEDDRERVERQLDDVLESCGEYEAEYRVWDSDGELRWVVARGHVECDGDGNPVTFLGALVDITERRERERAIEERERRYRTLAENFPNGLVTLFDHDLEYMLAAGQRFADIPPDPADVEGEKLYNVWDADTVDALEPAFEAALDGDERSVQLAYEGREWIVHVVPITGEKGDVLGGMAMAQDITERVERERELERTLDLLNKTERIADVGGWEIDTETMEVFWTEHIFELLDVPGDEEPSLEHALELYVEDDRPFVERAIEEALDTGDSFDVEARIRTYSGEVRWLRLRGIPETVDDAVVSLRGTAQDITERKQRERQQEAIADLGQLALAADDLDAFMHEASAVVADVLDTDYCKVLDLDEEANELLLRQGVGWDDGIVGEATVASDTNSQAGYTLISEEPVVVEDLATETRFSGPELLTSHDVTSGVSTIIGTVDEPWGILGTHDTDRRTFAEEDVNFVQSVANVLATAIERQQHEGELEALNQLNEAIRNISLTAVEAASQEEIKKRICEQLVETESYVFAWVGNVERGQSTVVPAAASGNDDGYLDEIDISVDDTATGRGPTGKAIRTGEPEFVHDIRHAPEYGAWREQARERGYRSSAAVPITHEGVTYGVLNVYADELRAFDGPQGEMLAQLGELVGHAIYAVEQRKALVSDTATELELRIADADHPLLATPSVDGEGASISLERRIPAGEETYVQFVTVRGMPPEEFAPAIEDRAPIRSVECISARDDESLFELTTGPMPITDTLASVGVRIREITVSGGAFRLVAEAPTDADVREVIEMIREIYPGAELLAQRTTVRDETSRQEMHAAITDQLTDKQRAALEAAYFAGYFEWPRVSNGEEVAELLDLSGPTFAEHIRAAQRKLFETVFDE